MKLKKLTKEIARKDTNFRVHYDIILSKKCCGTKKIIATSTNNDVWAKSVTIERAMVMKEIATQAVDRHNKKLVARGICARWIRSQILMLYYVSINSGISYGARAKIRYATNSMVLNSNLQPPRGDMQTELMPH